VLNHVLLHQTVIGLEAKDQMEIAGEYPDVVIGCVGGGSNFSGIAFPYLRDKLAGRDLRAVAVEPTACPTLTKGTFAYDFGDTAGLTPLLPMFTLGHSFVPPAIHAGGLRYHGGSPLLSDLVRKRLVEARAYGQTDVFDAALLFTRTEGILPAPESAHAIKAAIDEANDATNQGEERVILFCLSGHGHFDLSAYQAYLQGQLEDSEFPDEAMQQALEQLKGVSN
jgi:tryptophan synthase beta chain